MKVALYNQNAENIGEVELNSKIFGVKPSVHLLAEAVRTQLANARKGLSHTKTRGEVRGGGRKPWKQKGTGRARVGSIRSPLWRGGGGTFGPRSKRNWTLKINKKAKTKALFMSLSDKASDGRIFVIDTIKLSAPKTKEFSKFLSAFSDKAKLNAKKPLLLLPKNDQTIVRASRNLPHFKSSLATSLNVVDVMKADGLILLKDSLSVIEKTYLRSEKRKIQNEKQKSFAKQNT